MRSILGNMENSSDINLLITNFQKFNNGEINSAVEELDTLKEENRKHLQSLVYTNVVNRFDNLIDNLLIKFAIDGETNLHEIVLEKANDQQISAKEVYELLLSDEPKQAAYRKIEDIARDNFLRLRHSKKLRLLLESGFHVDSSLLDKPRVNANYGKIHVEVKPRSTVKVPRSIIGYADYLYCRRNSIVHGDGSGHRILKSDYAYLQKNFIKNPSKLVGLKLTSITSASTFYDYLCKFMLSREWTPGRNHKSKKNSAS